MQVEHGQAMAAPPRATRFTEEARSVVDRARAQAQHTAPSRSLATLASIRSTWIAGADAGVPNTVLEVLEATLHTHPASSPEAQLARRALDDLLALRDRHLRGGQLDPLNETTDREDEIERIADYAHTLRYDEQPQAINDALRALNGIREEVAADAILAAGRLPEPAQRERRIHLLWRMAADGVATSSGATIRSHLEQAAWSGDRSESTLARYALVDLDRLAINSGR